MNYELGIRDGEDNIKLSFVVPAFNEEKYISGCLRSIYNLKNLPPFEVIVADNNSTDRTREVVAREFFEVKIIAETKKGPAAARNAGARLARGKLIAFLDSDCRVPEGWLSVVMQEFDKSPKLALLQGPYRYFEAKSWFQKFVYYCSNVLFISFAELVFRKFLRIGGPAFGGDAICRKSDFEKIGGFNDNFEFYGEDIDFAKRMMKAGKVKFEPKAWVYSSQRRFNAEGNWKMWWIYSVNTVSSVLFGKVVYKKHRIIR